MKWVKQSWKRCIIVSSCNLQKEHHGEVTFQNLKSILLAYRILCKTLCWSIRAFVSKVVVLRIRKYIFFFSLTGVFQKDSRNNPVLCCLTVFASTRIKYNFLLVRLLGLQIWEFLTMWWSKITRVFTFPLSFF